MATLTNSFEGGSAASTITTGNSGGASGDAWTLTTTGTGSTCIYSTSGQAHGSLCMQVTTGATNTTERRGWAVNAGDTADDQWFRFYIDPGNVVGTVSPLRGQNAGSNAQRFRFQVTSAGQVTFRNSSNTALWTSSPNLTSGTQWRIECRVAGSTTGAARVWVYSGDSTTPTQDSGELVGDFGGTIREVWWGQTANGTNITVKFDDVGWSDTAALGPATTVYSGAADLAAASTLSTVGMADFAAVAALTASSDATIAAEASAAAAATLTAAAALTSTGISSTPGAVGMSAASALSTASTQSSSGQASLAAGSTLAATSARVQPGVVPLDAESSFLASTTVQQHAVAAMSAESSLTSDVFGEQQASALLAASTDVTILPSVSVPAVVDMTAATAMSAVSSSTSPHLTRGTVRLPKLSTVHEPPGSTVRTPPRSEVTVL